MDNGSGVSITNTMERHNRACLTVSMSFGVDFVVEISGRFVSFNMTN